MFRTTTLEFQKRTASDPCYAAQRDVADILALGCGVPVQIGNETIGGVGSSGSNQEEDDAGAKAGVAKVADLLASSGSFIIRMALTPTVFAAVRPSAVSPRNNAPF